MVKFNELRISNDSKSLIIDAQVLNDSYYDNVYIDNIIIDNQDTYIGTGPSSTPKYSYTVKSDLKRVALTIDYKELGNLNGILFVYVRTKGTPTPDTPCGKDNITTIGTVTNVYPFYQQAMGYMKELIGNCTIPKGFIDYMLRLKALELSIKTGNYPAAIDYYNRFFSGKETIQVNNGGCGCGNT